MSARIVRTETLHDGWTTLMMATIRPAEGTEYRREIEDHGNAAAVLPYDPDRRTAFLVRQLRVPLLYRGEADAYPLEAPAGIMDESDPAETVRREAMEEAGLRLRELEPVATAWSSPGLSCERIALFLAACSAADRVGQGGGLAEENEDIAVEEMPLRRLWALAESGGIVDLKTLTLVYALRLRHPELFG